MSRPMVLIAAVMALLFAGCPEMKQNQDVSLMQFVMEQKGYGYDVGMGDYDQNGVIDVSFKYLSGHEDKSDEDILADLAEAMGVTMAGCGYPIDKLMVSLRGTQYLALMSDCAKCVYTEKGIEPEPRDCAKAVWKKIP